MSQPLTPAMRDMVSNAFTFRPKAEMCCEACVFGSGIHAAFCPVARKIWRDTMQFVLENELPKAGESVTISKPRRGRFR